MPKDPLSENLKKCAITTGIDVLGFTTASEFKGYAIHGSQRRDPRLSLPNAKTIIVAGIYIGGVALPAWTNPWYGRTSRLYLSEFFLDVVKPLEPLVKLLNTSGYDARVCESATPEGSILPLKLAAVKAGLGWQGKHSLLISKTYGTFLALGGIITDADLTHNNRVEPDGCRRCDRCQRACPLQALDRPYRVDMEKCLSYLLQKKCLSENIDAIAENRIGDCEICQLACPWNAKHLNHPLTTPLTTSFQKKIEGWEEFFYLPRLIEMSETDYPKMFSHVNTGIPYPIFHRNVLMAIKNAERKKNTVAT